MTEGKNGIAGQEKGHITKEQFCDWLAGEMPSDGETEFLGHIGNCTFCAHQFAGWMETSPKQPNPPSYLKEEIVQRTQQIGMKVGVRVREKSRQMQLILYGLKVGLAVTTSIFLLMLTANIQELQPGAVREWRTEQMQQRREAGSQEERVSITDTLNQKSAEISGFLCDISNGLFRMGQEETNQKEIRR